MSKSRKSFAPENNANVDNVALAIIQTQNISTQSTEVKKETVKTVEKKPKQKEVKKVETKEVTPTPAPSETSKEIKTKRIQLVVKPSLYDDLQIITRIKGESMNNLANELLEEFINKNRDKIERYKEFIEEQ